MAAASVGVVRNEALGPRPEQPGPRHRPLSEMRRPGPAPVVNAVRVMFLRVAVAAVEIVVAVATRDTLKRELLAKTAAAHRAHLNRLFAPAFTLVMVAFVVYLVAYVLLALEIRKGRNWARIVIVVVACLTVVLSLASLFETEPAASHLVGTINAALDVVVIVLLVQRQSNSYFRAS